MAATQKSKQPAAKNGKQKANQQKEKIIGLIALIVVAFAGGAKVFGCAPAVDSNASATVSFLDVGQGDSVLIQAAGKTVLIDGGERDQGSVVLDDLKKYGVTTIDYMIASHPHSDHIGGLVDVLEDAAVSSDLTVSMVLLPEIPDKDVPTTRVYEAFLDGIEDNHIDPTFVSEKQMSLRLVTMAAGLLPVKPCWSRFNQPMQ